MLRKYDILSSFCDILSLFDMVSSLCGARCDILSCCGSTAFCRCLRWQALFAVRDATFCYVGGSTTFCRGSDSFAKSENENGVVLR